jgi:hypothetical protein
MLKFRNYVHLGDYKTSACLTEFTRGKHAHLSIMRVRAWLIIESTHYSTSSFFTARPLAAVPFRTAEKFL